MLEIRNVTNKYLRRTALDDVSIALEDGKTCLLLGPNGSGKTGSAEVSDDKSVETNAWVTGFVYDDAHPYAISVVIEGGGAGARMPSELAAKALKKAVEYVG